MIKEKNIAILIPAYKPDEKMLKLVDDLLKKEYNIIVVNDGSGSEFDGIFDGLHDVILLNHKENRGKGAALKTGISYIYEKTDYTHIITADADGQHTPSDISKLADFLSNTEEKFVIGSRKFTGNVPFKSKFGNKFTIGAFAIASGVRISDTQTGLRGFSRELFKPLINLDGDRYEYEINMLLYVAKQKIKLNEIEIETIYINENASSHFHPVRDSIKIYSCILKYCASSLISFGVDFILFLLFRFFLSILWADKTLIFFDFIKIKGNSAITTVSPALARILSSVVNFTLNKKVVFKSKEKTSIAAFKYFSLAAFVLVLNSVFIFILESLTQLPTLSYIITQIILFIMNYFIQKKFIFKSN